MRVYGSEGERDGHQARDRRGTHHGTPGRDECSEHKDGGTLRLPGAGLIETVRFSDKDLHFADIQERIKPVANDDTAITDEDAPVVVDVLSNDTGEHPLVVKASTLGDPANGTAELITSGTDAGKIRYTPEPDYSNTAANPDTFTYEACDDITPSECDGATVGVKVDPLNDTPVLSSIEGAALGYAEGDGPKAITDSLAVSDADGANLSGATVSISAGYQNGADRLGFANQNGLSGSFEGPAAR